MVQYEFLGDRREIEREEKSGKRVEGEKKSEMREWERRKEKEW